MRALILCLCWLLLGGCGQIPVSVDYQSGVDFSRFSHYYWLPPEANQQPESIYNSDLVSARVEQAVEQQLLSRSLLRIDNPEQADVLVRYQIGVEQMVEMEPFMGLEGSYSLHRSSYGSGLLSIVSHEYKQSTLVIDLLHPEDKRLLWRGTAERRLKTFNSPDQHSAFITETVAAVLAKYPPQP
ncbi:MAG: DUF4136 domain-containing protein [Halopseudomonas sp.]